MDITGSLRAVDEFQRRRAITAIPVAVWRKFSDEESASTAAGMAFWAFFSVFPLLMATVTILGYVLPANDRKQVLGQVNNYVPLIDAGDLKGLTGSALALIIGIAAALWSGLSVVTFTETALNSVWDRSASSGWRRRTGRGLLCLFVVGGGLLGATLMSGFLFGTDPPVDLGVAGRILGVLLAVLIDVGLLIATFRILTDDAVATRDVLPGAIFSGVSFWILQSLSSVVVTRHLASAQHTYGQFAIVITMLWWFYLQSQLTLLGAQANVVLKEHRYPRALLGGDEPAAAAREPEPAGAR